MEIIPEGSNDKEIPFLDIRWKVIATALRWSPPRKGGRVSYRSKLRMSSQMFFLTMI